MCKGCFSGLRSPAFSVLFWMFSFKYPSTDSSCYNWIQSWQSLTERWIYNLKPDVVWKKMTSILSLPLLVWRDAFKSGNCEVFNWKETLLSLQLMTIHTKLRSVWSRGWCFGVCREITDQRCKGSQWLQIGFLYSPLCISSKREDILIWAFQASPNCFSILRLGRPDNQKA